MYVGSRELHTRSTEVSVEEFIVNEIDVEAARFEKDFAVAAIEI